MRRKLCVAASIVGIVTTLGVILYLSPFTVAAASTPTTPIFTTGQTAFGIVAVNQSTGAISFCSNNTLVPTGGGQEPIGTCSASSIGTVTPTAGSSNSISIAGSGNSVLVYNNQTGHAVLCAGSGVVNGTALVTSTVANVVASCKSVTNLH